MASEASTSVLARQGRGAVVGVLRSRLWLLLPIVALDAVLFLVPLGLMAKTGIADGADAYRELVDSALVKPIVVNTVVISTITTLVAVVLAYICALAAWRAGFLLRSLILALVLLPFWTGVLVKNFAWAALMQDNGVINDLLQSVGITDHPVTILHTRFAVIVGMVHYVLPYAVLPILAVMLTLDRRLERAAASLGASTWRTGLHVVLPLTLPGVWAGAILVFIISVGFFITPVVLGGPQDQMVANLIEYYALDRIEFAAASILAIAVTVAVSLLVALYQRIPKEGQYGAA